MGIKDIASRVKAASSDAQAALNAKIAQAANSRAGDAAKIAISTGKTLLSAIETARPDFSAEIPSASLDAVDAYIDALRGDIDAAQQTLDQMQREAMMPGEVPDAAALIQNTNDLLTTIAETPVQVNVDGPIVFTDTSIDRGVTVETNRELPYMNINIDKAIENAQKAEADANQAETSNDQVEQTANADPVDIAPELYADENALPQDFAGVEQQAVTEDAWSTRMNASEQAWIARSDSTADAWAAQQNSSVEAWASQQNSTADAWAGQQSATMDGWSGHAGGAEAGGAAAGGANSGGK